MAEEESEKDQINEAEPEVVEENIETLKQALTEERAKAEGYLANWQRTQADFINYKRRSEQEKEEVSKFGNAIVMHSLLTILDDFDRAFTSIPEHLDKLSWVDGIKLIERKLRASLEAQGLSEIKAMGEPFDPYLHEAVRQDRGEEGMVIGEMQKGYKFRERVIRPTRVVVGNGEEK